MTKYRVTYKMDVPGEDGNILFVVFKEISRYTRQDPYDWFKESRAEWAGRKIVSIEMID
ncbi:MAG TPA: hypothetical protein VMH38_00595 [Thermoplasmata archaeon]|nr:hypothetical protein [Thermoplasmata archaeon]